ncbi:MAG TPA: GFA family protein [Candidatus Binatia bacterium]|jgi:hypothetical protein|nr:GFA family protein [Candidatus Binatia bacterium]
MTPPYDGGCLCGDVRYRVTGEPLTLYACHCTDCQRRTGTSFALSLMLRRSDLTVLQGTTVPYGATLSDGRRKQGQSCASCGTRLWGEPVAAPHIVVVQPGTLDDTSWLRPIAHIWMRSAQPWIVIPDGVATFDAQPPDLKELVALWRRA